MSVNPLSAGSIPAGRVPMKKCDVCGRDLIIYQRYDISPMLHNRRYYKVAKYYSKYNKVYPSRSGCYCISCVEKALGRRMRINDLRPCLAMVEFLYPCIPRMNVRFFNYKKYKELLSKADYESIAQYTKVIDLE